MKLYYSTQKSIDLEEDLKNLLLWRSSCFKVERFYEFDNFKSDVSGER